MSEYFSSIDEAIPEIRSTCRKDWAIFRTPSANVVLQFGATICIRVHKDDYLLVYSMLRDRCIASLFLAISFRVYDSVEEDDV